MSTICLTLFLALLPADDSERSDTSRKPNPFAPSLPLLTEKEEEQLDAIIDRFILFDTGKLPGAEGKKALIDFQRLGPEAIFALIRGLNKSAAIDHSCPALTIAKKIATILRATDDLELLQFAYENIGIGVKQSRHMNVLKDLRVVCIVQKSYVARRGSSLRTTGRDAILIRPPRQMTTAELAKAVENTRGAALPLILRELATRQGDEVFAGLAFAAKSNDSKTKELATELLDGYVSKQNEAFLKERLQDEKPHVRAMAARIIGNKKLRLVNDLIERLTDADSDVRQSARGALVKIAAGPDFGPQPDESIGGQLIAAKKWREWWQKQGGS